MSASDMRYIPWEWKPTKKEIGEWVEQQEDTFACQETQNLKIDVENWKQRYLFSDLHELFFVEFPTILFQWLK